MRMLPVRSRSRSETQGQLPMLRPTWRESLTGISKWLVRNPVVLGSFVTIFAFILAAVFADVLVPYNPNQQAILERLQPPGGTHWLGTDNFGRDVLSRVIVGARISLQVSLVSCLLGTFIGSLLGAVAAYRGGILDTLLNRLMDIALAFPALVLTMALVAVLGVSLRNVIIAITLSIIPRTFRLMRGTVYSIRERDYVKAAWSLGASHTRIIFRHILPNSMAPVVVYATLQIPMAIIAESSLAFLGLGVPPPTPTWGGMVSEGKGHLLTAPWVALAPGGAIALTVLAFNLIGDAARDLLDVRIRKKRK